MESGQFFLSALEIESLVSYFYKLLYENKDTQDYIYTCDKPATKQDVTIRFKDGILSVWLNENGNPASLLSEFNTKELILTIHAGGITDTLRQSIFSQSIRGCIEQAILKKYGYKVYFARNQVKRRDVVYCQCSILNDKGGFVIKKFRIYPNSPLYFRFDLKNLAIENLHENK